MNSIVIQPQNVSANVGEVVTFTIDCGESDVLAYQWMWRGDQWGTWYNFTGKTTNTCTFTFYGMGHNGRYDRETEMQYGSVYENEYRCMVTFTDNTQVLSDIVKVNQARTMAQYIQQGFYEGILNGFHFRETSDQLGDFPIEWIHENGQLLYDIMRQEFGWKIDPICAIIGNMWTECKLNPGMWQTWRITPVYEFTTQGYGWVQWTPQSVLAEIDAKYFPNIPYRNNGRVQIDTLYLESQNPRYYEPGYDPLLATSNLQWGNFLDADDVDLEGKTEQFMDDYCMTEHRESLPGRIHYAYEAKKLFAKDKFPIWMMKRLTKEGRLHI